MQGLKKIVVIGGESTGKSTLCEQLAIAFNTVFVKEYAREYLENLHHDYVKNDLLAIAKGQINLENKMIADANKYLFCDTNLLVIKVWSEHKYNECDRKILNLLSQTNYDAYIITTPDMEWTYDALREHPNPNDRNYFFTMYQELVIDTQKPFCIVNGNEENRLQQAIYFINHLK